MQYPKNTYIYDGVSMSDAFVTQFVNMVNCIIFPCIDDVFSFVSITVATHQLRMESMLDC